MSSIPLVGISLLLGGAPATSEERVVAHNLCHANAEFEFIRVLVRLRALLFQSVDHGTQRCGNVPLKCLCRFRGLFELRYWSGGQELNGRCLFKNVNSLVLIIGKRCLWAVPFRCSCGAVSSC